MHYLRPTTHYSSLTTHCSPPYSLTKVLHLKLMELILTMAILTMAVLTKVWDLKLMKLILTMAILTMAVLTKVWDLKLMKLIFTFSAGSEVFCLAMSNNTVYGGCQVIVSIAIVSIAIVTTPSMAARQANPT